MGCGLNPYTALELSERLQSVGKKTVMEPTRGTFLVQLHSHITFFFINILQTFITAYCIIRVK